MKLRGFALGTVLAGALLSIPSTAQADEVTPTGKGIVGGALLGGEIVCFGEAIFGVHSGLAYIIGGVAGMGAGGVGGYFIEKGSTDGRIPVYLLAAGIAALIPAVVVTLDATRYQPTEGARDDKPTDGPPSDPGQPGGSSVVGAPAAAPTPPSPPPPAPAAPTGGATQAPQARRAPSLVGVRNGQLAIGVPVPEVRPILGSADRARFGVDNRGSELRFPVLNVTF